MSLSHLGLCTCDPKVVCSNLSFGGIVASCRALDQCCSPPPPPKKKYVVGVPDKWPRPWVLSSTLCMSQRRPRWDMWKEAGQHSSTTNGKQTFRMFGDFLLKLVNWKPYVCEAVFKANTGNFKDLRPRNIFQFLLNFCFATPYGLFYI